MIGRGGVNPRGTTRDGSSIEGGMAERTGLTRCQDRGALAVCLRISATCCSTQDCGQRFRRDVRLGPQPGEIASREPSL